MISDHDTYHGSMMMIELNQAAALPSVSRFPLVSVSAVDNESVPMSQKTCPQSARTAAARHRRGQVVVNAYPLWDLLEWEVTGSTQGTPATCGSC